MEKTRPVKFRPFLSSGWFLSWMQLTGLLPYGTTASTSLYSAGNGCGIPTCRTIITTAWSVLVLIFVVLYAAADFQESFLEFYREKLNDLEFFTLAIHSFRIFSNLLAAVLIIIALVRKRNLVPGFVQRVSLELAESSTDLRNLRRLVQVSLIFIPLCVVIVCLGCTFTVVQVVRYEQTRSTSARMRLVWWPASNFGMIVVLSGSVFFVAGRKTTRAVAHGHPENCLPAF